MVTGVRNILILNITFVIIAEYKLVAFISHMGTSSSVGHYVCHVLHEGQWVIFNDNKVYTDFNIQIIRYLMYFENYGRRITGFRYFLQNFKCYYSFSGGPIRKSAQRSRLPIPIRKAVIIMLNCDLFVPKIAGTVVWDTNLSVRLRLY